jgi:hypothetical protein
LESGIKRETPAGAGVSFLSLSIIRGEQGVKTGLAMMKVLKLGNDEKKRCGFQAAG